MIQIEKFVISRREPSITTVVWLKPTKSGKYLALLYGANGWQPITDSALIKEVYDDNGVSLDKILSQMDDNTQAIEDKVSALEETINSMNETITSMTNILQDHEGRIEVLEKYCLFVDPDSSSTTSVGDVVLYDSQTGEKVTVSPDNLNIDDYPADQFTPIGIVVIPSSHDIYGTKQGAMISLVHMDYTTPDEGSVSTARTMCFGYNNALINKAYTEYIYTGTVETPSEELTGTGVSATRLPSDSFDSSSVCPTDEKAYYYGSNSTPVGPSPYNGDLRNTVYYSVDECCLSDLNGEGNTKALLNAVTVSNWQTSSTINNSTSEGNYPAVECCWRYSTVGTAQGDWYLPAEGELGYAIVRLATINETITTINSIYGTLGAQITIGRYWSSTEEDEAYAQTIIMNSGEVFCYRKVNDYYVRAFCKI